MDDNLLSRAQFFLIINGLPDAALKVRRVSGQADGISSHFDFHISCIAEERYTLSDWIIQPAILHWLDDYSAVSSYRHGIIAAAECTGQDYDGYHYNINLVSRLHPLLLRYNERIFLNKTLSEILTEILQSAGFLTAQFRIQLKNDPTISYRVQFQQSDYNFLQALMVQYGVQFVWQHGETQAVLIFVDQITALNATSISIGPLINTAVTQISELLTPQTTIIQTDNRLLQPGQLIELNQQAFRITNIEHEMQQNSADLARQNQLHYCATLTLIDPSLQPYVNPDADNLITLVNAPLFTSKTETVGGQYPYLDTQGRYFTRLPFDQSHSAATQASPPQYLVQAHGNNVNHQSNGLHFPMQANTDMAVSHVKGDINQPILLGAFANPSTAATVNADNNSQYIQRSWGGNQLLIDDQQQHSRLQFNNPQQQNILLLDASADVSKIHLQSQGQINYQITRNVTLQTQASHLQTSQQNHQTTIQNQHQLTAKQQLLQSGRNIGCTAAKNLNLQAQGQTMVLNTLQQASLMSSTIQIQSQQDLQLQSTQTTVLLYAKQNMSLQGQSGINLQSSGSGIAATATGLLLTTPTLKVNAQSIRCPQPTPG